MPGMFMDVIFSRNRSTFFGKFSENFLENFWKNFEAVKKFLENFLGADPYVFAIFWKILRGTPPFWRFLEKFLSWVPRLKEKGH